MGEGWGLDGHTRVILVIVCSVTVTAEPQKSDSSRGPSPALLSKGSTSPCTLSTVMYLRCEGAECNCRLHLLHAGCASCQCLCLQP
jgi:hypothetical protein